MNVLESSYLWWGVALFAAGLFGTAWLRGDRAGDPLGRSTRSSSKRLFLGLCRAHGLARSDRRLLARLARFQGLDSPGRLFLEPDRFDPAALDPRAPDGPARYQSLRDRIFAGLEVQ